MDQPPRVMSLFAGFGGLDLALDAVLGGELVAVSEIDPGACRILAHHWPDVENIGDVTRVDWSQWAGKVDVITGGSPCTDVSSAGRRRGMTEGTRSNLWVSMREAIATIRPSLVIWENVRGAFSAVASSNLEPCSGCVGDESATPYLRALGRVLGDLSTLGYDARWIGLRASDIGAAHHRFRVFVVAWPRSLNPGHGTGGTELELEREGRRGTGQPGQDPADTIGRRLQRWACLSGRCAQWRTAPGWRCDCSDEGGPDTDERGRGRERGIEPDLRDTDRPDGTNGLRCEAESPAPVTWMPTPTADRDGNTPETHLARKPGRKIVTSLDVVVNHMLPTPRASDGSKGSPNQRGSSGDLMLASATAYLPTPQAGDVLGGPSDPSRRRADGHAVSTADAISVLPTPVTTDSANPGPGDLRRKSPGLRALAPDKFLPTPMVGSTSEASHNQISGQYRRDMDAALQDWREYEPAIRRQEQAFGRPAPLPTEPNAKGEPRLAPVFSEWLMGLPAGWITDPAIWTDMHPSKGPIISRGARIAMLRAAGNGVVWQQGAAAIATMVRDIIVDEQLEISGRTAES